MLEIRPTALPLGHEIQGVDLSQELDAATFAGIEEAFDKYGVIVFRNQKLTPEQQIAFSRRLGPLERYMVETYLLPGHPEIFVVSNVIENGRPIGMADAGRLWHSDMPVVAEPPRGSALYAREVPVRDGIALGDTLFASTQAAYDALPADTKKRIDGLQVVFSYGAYIDTRRNRLGYADAAGDTGQGAHERQRTAYPDVLHPLVRVHPRTGRKCLYLSDGAAKSIVGLPEEEGRALIRELLDHIVRPEFVYRHSWRVGDLVLWDNCSAVHRATPDFELPLRRVMHRTTLKGSRPVGVAA